MRERLRERRVGDTVSGCEGRSGDTCGVWGPCGGVALCAALPQSARLRIGQIAPRARTCETTLYAARTPRTACPCRCACGAPTFFTFKLTGSAHARARAAPATPYPPGAAKLSRLFHLCLCLVIPRILDAYGATLHRREPVHAASRLGSVAEEEVTLLPDGEAARARRSTAVQHHLTLVAAARDELILGRDGDARDGRGVPLHAREQRLAQADVPDAHDCVVAARDQCGARAVAPG